MISIALQQGVHALQVTLGCHKGRTRRYCIRARAGMSLQVLRAVTVVDGLPRARPRRFFADISGFHR